MTYASPFSKIAGLRADSDKPSAGPVTRRDYTRETAIAPFAVRNVIVIHHGQLLFDGDLSALVEKFSAFKTVGFTVDNHAADWTQYGDVVSVDGSRVTMRVPKEKASAVTSRLLNELSVEDLTVEAAPIEDVIESVFSVRKEALE